MRACGVRVLFGAKLRFCNSLICVAHGVPIGMLREIVE